MSGRYKKGWSKVHQQVFKMHLDGLTPMEITEKSGLTYNKVRGIMDTKQFREHRDDVVESCVESARKLFERKLVEAAEHIVRTMKYGKPDERIRYDAAKEILYQCGMKPVEVVETRTRDYTPAELESSLKVVQEIRTIEGVLSTKESGFLVNTSKDEVVVPVEKVEEEAVSNDLAPVPAYVATQQEIILKELQGV